MYRKYFFADFNAWLITGLCFILALVAGSIYCGFTADLKCEQMYSYLTGFFKSTGELNKYNTFIGGLKNYGIIFLVILVSGFFKAGVFFNIAVLMKKGFVTGFTMAAFFKVFGFSGLWAIAAILPELLLFCPALLFFSASSTKISILTPKREKNFLIFFLIFSVFFGAIFCGSAFWNGYVTTIFMKYASYKIL